MSYLAQNIVFLRKKMNVKQSEICDRLGFVRNTWSNWENGISVPDMDKLIIISDFFNVGLDELLRIDLSQGKVLENGKIAKNSLKGKGNGKESTENTPVEGLLQDPLIGYNTPSTREHIQLQIIAEKDEQITSQEITIRTLKLALEQALKGRK